MLTRMCVIHLQLSDKQTSNSCIVDVFHPGGTWPEPPGKACPSASQELVDVSLTECAIWEQVSVAGNLQAAGSGSQLSVHLTL